MASEQTSNQPASAAISPAMRKRLQTCFDRGNEVLKQEKPDRDYAHTMFSECVLRDPGNLEYVERMLQNLQLKYNNNKKGSRLRGFSGRGAFKKAVAAADWEEVFHIGLDLLKSNPWDVATLRGLAQACAAQHLNEVELRYLKNALDVNPKDVEVNRHCAQTLARVGQFDQAIGVWMRIGELDKSKKDEAKRMMSELTVAKARGVPLGLDDSESKNAKKPIVVDDDGNKKKSSSSGASSGRGSSAEGSSSGEASPAPSKESSQTSNDSPVSEPPDSAAKSSQPQASDGRSIKDLEAAIVKDPSESELFIELAEKYTEEQRFRDAYQTLKRALEAAGGQNLTIQELLEEAQIRMYRHQVAIAEQRAANEKTPETAELAKRFRAELNRQELQIFSARCERYPDDLSLQFELGLRLKRESNYYEARKAFEKARGDREIRAAATVELGECLQHLKQYSNALKCYRAATKEAGDQTSDLLKKSLYRTGVLAAALKNLELAEDSFQRLLEMDPGYRDAEARLDKVKQIGDSV